VSIASLAPAARSGSSCRWRKSAHEAVRSYAGPCVARSEKATLALLLQATERFRGQVPLFIIPMDRRELVETLYEWGARNVETHLFQVRGKFQPFNGVSLPSFLPETG